jgi:hypothetical protein
MYENRVLRTIFGPEWEVREVWRKMHNELHNFYSSPNIIRVAKSRLRWMRYVAHVGQTRNACRILEAKPEDHFEG